jgi:hypothetical protein
VGCDVGLVETVDLSGAVAVVVAVAVAVVDARGRSGNFPVVVAVAAVALGIAETDAVAVVIVATPAVDVAVAVVVALVVAVAVAVVAFDAPPFDFVPDSFTIATAPTETPTSAASTDATTIPRDDLAGRGVELTNGAPVRPGLPCVYGGVAAGDGVVRGIALIGAPYGLPPGVDIGCIGPGVIIG